MNEVIKKLSEIQTGEVGIIIYSPAEKNVIASFNGDLNVPLASAGKVAIGFVVTKWVQLNYFSWSETVSGIEFDEKEDSRELYPHLQGMQELTLENAIEVMVACHDNVIAKRVVEHCGGWHAFNEELQKFFRSINLKSDSTDIENSGNLNELFILLNEVYEGYISDSGLWKPVVNGLVRQQGPIEGIPAHHLNHMTGGLPTALVHLGMLGEFHHNPLLYVVGVKNLPDRSGNGEADVKVTEALRMMYNHREDM
ncbi:serine hydrolase [Pseudalkalibacillus sp. Hm43]|uniref:serine hydrolase n=1 Tax=Pseudalkalibacillus sp. Hm43 TaxID=3450742 RepID=UPI003F41B98E